MCTPDGRAVRARRRLQQPAAVAHDGRDRPPLGAHPRARGAFLAARRARSPRRHPRRRGAGRPRDRDGGGASWGFTVADAGALELRNLALANFANAARRPPGRRRGCSMTLDDVRVQDCARHDPTASFARPCALMGRPSSASRAPPPPGRADLDLKLEASARRLGAGCGSDDGGHLASFPSFAAADGVRTSPGRASPRRASCSTCASSCRPPPDFCLAQGWCAPRRESVLAAPRVGCAATHAPARAGSTTVAAPSHAVQRRRPRLSRHVHARRVTGVLARILAAA